MSGGSHQRTSDVHNGPSDRMDAETDFYAVLNVPRTASAADIRRAYKQLRIFHPDKVRMDQQSEAQQSFVLIKLAHDILLDRVLRLAYDYAGLVAVNLVKRSQASASASTTAPDADTHDDIALGDLYNAMLRASDADEAVSILQEALEEEQVHQQQHSSVPLDASLQISSCFDRSGRRLQRDSTVLQVQSKQQLSDWTMTMGATSEVKRTGATALSTSLGADYQPVRGTRLGADATVQLRALSSPQISMRTSRQLASGTFIMVALAGSLKSVKSWTYSLITYRNILWGSDETEGRVGLDSSQNKVQASWRVGVKPSGKVQFLVASLRNLVFPRWRVRLNLSPYPFKISFQPAETNCWYVSASQGYMWSRLKVLWLRKLGCNWTLKYGIKYESLAVLRGEVPWTIICQFVSSDWTIRLPIGLYHSNNGLLGWMMSFMVAQLLDHQLQSWNDSIASHRSEAAARRARLQPFSSTPTSFLYSDVVRRVAEKKSLLERKAGGLVILDAIWREGGRKDSSDGGVDVASVLQFWVVDGQLHLPLHERRWWFGGSMDEEDHVWTWSWWKLFDRPRHQRPQASPADAGSLCIRYQFGPNVFEIQFEGDELVWLPNKRATLIGKAGQVR